jgi:phenylacetate-coenzyme A ligase PaaK-like adenylate-forming protein
MPTFLYHVLSEAAARGAHWPQLRRLVLGGGKVPDGMRRKLRALTGNLGAGPVDVIATYAFTEAKMAWVECPAPPGGEPSGYHLSPDLAIIEIIDPDTGRTVGPMQPGEIVFTALDSRGTVVLRYRTGDRIDGGLTFEPCLYCGRAVPRLVGNISRVSEIRQLHLDKLKGTLVDFNSLEHVLDDIDGLGPWQIELRKVHDDPFECDEIVIHAVAERAAQRDDLERTITRRFIEATELRPNRFEWHSAADMRRRHGVGRLLKEEKLVDHRSRPDIRVDPETGPERSFSADDSPAVLI